MLFLNIHKTRRQESIAENAIYHTIETPLHIHKVANTSDLKYLGKPRSKSGKCSYCYSKDNLAISCLACQWDACGGCVKSYEKKIKEEHLMTSRIANWCNKNNANVPLQSGKGEFSHILYCFSDGCGPTGLQCKSCYGHCLPPIDRHGHQMNFVKQEIFTTFGSTSIWNCDLCGKSSRWPPDSWRDAYLGRYRCKSCDFNICIDCAIKWPKIRSEEIAEDEKQRKEQEKRNEAQKLFDQNKDKILKNISTHTTSVHPCKLLRVSDIKKAFETDGTKIDSFNFYDEYIDSVECHECCDDIYYYCKECEYGICFNCYKSEENEIRKVYGKRNFDKNSKEEVFDSHITNLSPQNKNTSSPLEFVVWTSLGYGNDGWHTYYGPPTREFDSSFSTVQEANRRARYKFFVDNPWGLSCREMKETLDNGEEYVNENTLCIKFKVHPDDSEIYTVAVVPRVSWEHMDDDGKSSE